MADHVVQGDGGTSALPDGGPDGLIHSSDELVAFVNALAGKGWRTWNTKLAPEILTRWRHPIVVENEWLVNDRALFFNWQMYIMSIIVQEHPKYFNTVAEVHEQKSAVPRGVAVLHKPIPIRTIMHSMKRAKLFAEVDA